MTDGYGRTINYTYDGPESGYRLRQITDFLGRQLDFQYNAGGRLVAVLTPSINKAAAGNTFPGGTAYAFEYDVNNPRPDRRDDLVRIYYPNQTLPFLDVEARAVDVAEVYANATPRYQVGYGQDATDASTYGKVVSETVGDPGSGVGGTSSFSYTTTGLPPNLIDPADPIVSRTTVTDRNDNRVYHDFDANWLLARKEVLGNRGKSSLQAASFVTWAQFNAQGQALQRVYPAGNSVQYTYEDGDVSGLPFPYVQRRGLLRVESRFPGNTIGVPSRPGSDGQTVLTRRYFYEPLFNQVAAFIEERGNPIDAATGAYFTPQNGGAAPTDADRSRYATLFTFDYQKDTAATVTGDPALQALLGLTAGQIAALIDYASGQMQATDGAGGLPAGFPMGLGGVNGDGTGDGAASGLPAATHLGNLVRTTYPAVLLVGGELQVRTSLQTVNRRGQVTTVTDPEGNLTIYVRYPQSDPDGAGELVSASRSGKEYGMLKETHVDADPNSVIDLVGADGDLADFVPGLIPRTNTPGAYQDLVTRNGGGSRGCTACSYDPLGNALSATDARGFTTSYDRNELGEVYRTTAPAPYNYKVETYYDANRNVTRVDTEDQVVAYESRDPTDPSYAQFLPTGNGMSGLGVAQVPSAPGDGGAVRPGWFSNLFTYDLLDNKTSEDIDAAGSDPASLLTGYAYDPNENLIRVTKPMGNTVEYDHDERDLRIAKREGYVAGGEPGAVTVMAYDPNGNLLDVIGPTDRTGLPGIRLTATLADGFRSGLPMTHTGDWVLQNIYDGFDRAVQTTDAVGNVALKTFDPGSRLIRTVRNGSVGGPSPTDRTGATNVTLAGAQTRFDEAGRPYEQQQDVFLAAGAVLPSGRSVTHTGGGLAANSTANDHTATVTLTAGQSSYVLERNLYDRSGRVTQQLADNTAATTFIFDGANRVIAVVDPLGNRADNTLDANGNVIAVTRTQLGTMPTASGPEVFRSALRYDALNRLVLTAQQGADGQFTNDLTPCCANPAAPSTLVSLYGYDSRNNRTLEIDRKGNTTVTVYDGASRSVQTLVHLRLGGDGANPPAANRTFLEGGRGAIRTDVVLDGNGRMARLIDDRGAQTSFGYDTLDRQTAMTFEDGSVRTTGYNAAGDAVAYTDENGSAFAFTHDAAGRRTAVAVAPATGVAGTTAQGFEYDGLSRLTFARDTTGASSRDVGLAYESLDRMLEEQQVFDGADARFVTRSAWIGLPSTGFTFPNSRQLGIGYDAMYRKNSLGESGGGPPIARWQFFGDRVATVSLGNGILCSLMNDAQSRSAVQAGQPTPPWGNAAADRLGFDGAGRPITKRYLFVGIPPSSSSSSSSSSASSSMGPSSSSSSSSSGFPFSYSSSSAPFSPSALSSSSSPPGSSSSSSLPTAAFAPGFARFGGFASPAAAGVPSLVVGFTTAYDRSSNKLYERHLHAESRSHLYPSYDSPDRLREYRRGVLAAGGASVAAPITLAGADADRTYELDGLGNWTSTGHTPAGGSPVTETRRHNLVNQLVRVGATPVLYDHGNNAASPDPDVRRRGNGNIADDGTRLYFYDALNRLIQVRRKSDGVAVAAYEYDALGRRVLKTVSGGGVGGSVPDGATRFLYEASRCVEELDGSAATTRQYVWGQYVDELIQMRTYVSSGPQPLAAGDYYLLSDLLDRSVALTDDSGAVVEAYDTDAYGNTLVFSGPGPDGRWFTDDDTRASYAACRYVFTGREWDAESGLYFYRARYYHPQFGRFISRDLLLFAGGMNAYEYANGRPAVLLDPEGELAALLVLVVVLAVVVLLVIAAKTIPALGSRPSRRLPSMTWHPPELPNIPESAIGAGLTFCAALILLAERAVPRVRPKPRGYDERDDYCHPCRCTSWRKINGVWEQTTQYERWSVHFEECDSSTMVTEYERMECLCVQE